MDHANTGSTEDHVSLTAELRYDLCVKSGSSAHDDVYNHGMIFVLILVCVLMMMGLRIVRVYQLWVRNLSILG